LPNCPDCNKETRKITRCWDCHTAHRMANAGPGKAAEYQRAHRARKAAGIPAPSRQGAPRIYPRCPVCPEKGKCNACQRARRVRVPPRPSKIREMAHKEPRPRTVQVTNRMTTKRTDPFEGSTFKACPTCMTRHKGESPYCKRHLT